MDKPKSQYLEDYVLQSSQQKKLTAKQLASVADDWFATRKDRYAADKVAMKLKEREQNAYALLIEQMRMQELTAIGGARVRVGMSLEPTYEPHVVDWDSFYAFILETKDFSLLERRPGRSACKERWEDDVVVPGVEKFPVYKLTSSEVK